jgi:hypothetical protein
MTAPAIPLGRGLAALLGAPLVAFVLGAALVVGLPLPHAVTLPLGAHAILWTWVALAVALPLCRSGARAWGWCVALGSLAALTLAFGRSA